MRKKGFLFMFLAVLLTVTLFAESSVKANEMKKGDTDSSIEIYEVLIEDGILSDNIDYETWSKMNEQIKEEESVYLEKNKIHLKEIQASNKINAPEDDISVIKGDILITNGTSLNGLTGHTGIAVGSNEVLHTQDKNSVPEVISLDEWLEMYGIGAPDDGFVPTNTEVYRMENIDDPMFRSYPGLAADWAREAYENSGYEYKITTDLHSIDPTYCSKIVWQAYNNAAGQWGPRFLDIPATNIPTPYGMPTYFKNGFELELITII